MSPLCKLEKTAAGERGDRLRDVFLNLNLPFAPKDFSHGSVPSVMTTENSVLEGSILRPLERSSGDQAAELAVEIYNWVINNIELPKDVKCQLSKAVARRASAG